MYYTMKSTYYLHITPYAISIPADCKRKPSSLAMFKVKYNKGSINWNIKGTPRQMREL